MSKHLTIFEFSKNFKNKTEIQIPGQKVARYGFE